MQSKHFLVRTILLISLDFLFCWISWFASVFVFTYLFKNNDTVLLSVVYRYWWVLLSVCLISFALTGVYKSLWQHPGFGSILRLLTGVWITSFSMYITFRIDMGYWSNPGLGMMAFYFLLTLTMGFRLTPRGYQLTMRYLRRRTSRKSSAEEISPVRTLMIGAGESASNFLLHPTEKGIRPREILGILDCDSRKKGYVLHGVRVLGDDSMLSELCRQLEIEEVIIAVPSMKNDTLRKIVQQVPIRQCRVRILSGLYTGPTAELLRDISIGDLLGRPENILDMAAASRWIQGKTVLITGGGGSIGSEICRQVMHFNPSMLVIYDVSENNAHNIKEELTLSFGANGKYRVAIRIGSVQDKRRLESVFTEYNPSIVFHAAAYKHVPLMEQCPRLALENNVLGTYYTGCCSLQHGVERFVMISTDKAVNPTNIMGASKRLAELLLLSLNGVESTEFVCVRFGNVLDSNGSVVPLFKRQIQAGGPVTVTHPEIIRYFMTIPEATRLVLEAGAMAKGGEIFILNMGKPVKILDLAENLIRLAGLTPGVDIQIQYTGLRPGEKLYEELMLNEEGLRKTDNEKIYAVTPVPMTKETRETFLRQLESTLLLGSSERALIAQYVPEYCAATDEELDNIKDVCGFNIE